MMIMIGVRGLNGVPGYLTVSIISMEGKRFLMTKKSISRSVSGPVTVIRQTRLEQLQLMKSGIHRLLGPGTDHFELVRDFKVLLVLVRSEV